MSVTGYKYKVKAAVVSIILKNHIVLQIEYCRIRAHSVVKDVIS